MWCQYDAVSMPLLCEIKTSMLHNKNNLALDFDDKTNLGSDVQQVWIFLHAIRTIFIYAHIKSMFVHVIWYI